MSPDFKQCDRLDACATHQDWEPFDCLNNFRTVMVVWRGSLKISSGKVKFPLNILVKMVVSW